MNSANRLVGFALVALWLAGCEPAAHPNHSAEERVSFRMETGDARNERIVTDAIINGQPTRLALDTGSAAPFVLFSPSVARLKLTVVHPVPTDAGPVPGQAPVGETAPYEVQLAGQRSLKTILYFFDVPKDVSLEGDVDGIIGWPAIAGNIWAFFLGHEEPLVTALESFSVNDDPSWTKFDVRDGDTLSLVRDGDPPRPPRLLIDTGNADGVMLPPVAWLAWQAEHPTTHRTIHGSYMPGQALAASDVVWADEIRIGDLVLHGVPVQEADAAYLRKAAPGEEIVAFGLAALKRLDVVVDGNTRVAYARPTSFLPRPYRHNRTGVQFIPRDATNADLVAHVSEGSPAARAGVRDDDVLLKINGWDTSGWRSHVADLAKRLNLSAPAGTIWNFTLRRGDKIVEARVVAEDLLGPSAKPAK